jgi:hypothetical protein
MGLNDHLEDYRPALPTEAGDNSRLGFQVNHEWFEGADSDMRHEVMRIWFLSRYWDPANETPYNSKEGGYLYIYGGPYDAKEELDHQFCDMASEEDIQAVVDDVESDGIFEWAPIHTELDYDEEFQVKVNRCTDPLLFFTQRLNEVDSLKALEVNSQQRPLLFQLLYSSLITALETYLENTMSFWVAVDDKVLRKFVLNCQEFQKQKLKLSEIFNRMDGLQDEVDNYLQQLIWHRLDKVIPLMSDSLDIKHPPIDKLMQYLLRRHDIVHRGGKDKDGYLLSISIEELNQLQKEVVEFVEHIQSMLVSRFPGQFFESEPEF